MIHPEPDSDFRQRIQAIAIDDCNGETLVSIMIATGEELDRLGKLFGLIRHPAPLPDWPPTQSAIGLPEGHRRFGSTGQLFEVKGGRWERVRTP